MKRIAQLATAVALSLSMMPSSFAMVNDISMMGKGYKSTIMKRAMDKSTTKDSMMSGAKKRIMSHMGKKRATRRTILEGKAKFDMLRPFSHNSK